MTTDGQPKGKIGCAGIFVLLIVLGLGIKGFNALTGSHVGETTTTTAMTRPDLAPDGSWGSASESGFLDSCESNGTAPSKCECALGWFEKHYTEAELNRFSADETDALAASAMDSCL